MRDEETDETTSVLEAMNEGSDEKDYDNDDREYERTQFLQYTDQRKDGMEEGEKNQTSSGEEKDQEQEKTRQSRIPKKPVPEKRELPPRKKRSDEPHVPLPIEEKVSGKETNNNNNDENEGKTNDNNKRGRNNNNSNRKNNRNNNNRKNNDKTDNHHKFLIRMGIVSENSNEISRYRKTIKNIMGIGIKYIEKIIESKQESEKEKMYMKDINEIKDKMGEEFSNVINMDQYVLVRDRSKKYTQDEVDMMMVTRKNNDVEVIDWRDNNNMCRELEKVKSGNKQYKERLKEAEKTIEKQRRDMDELESKIREITNNYNVVLEEKKEMKKEIEEIKTNKRKTSQKKNTKQKNKKRKKKEEETKKKKEEERKTNNKQEDKYNSNSANNVNKNNNISDSKNNSQRMLVDTKKTKQLRIEQKSKTVIKKTDGEEITIAGGRKVKDKNEIINAINVAGRPCTAYK